MFAYCNVENWLDLKIKMYVIIIKNAKMCYEQQATDNWMTCKSISLITRRKRKDFKEQVTFCDVPIQSKVVTIVSVSIIMLSIVPQ